MTNLDKIKEAIEAKLIAMGLELHDLQFNSAGRHSVLRVFIDRAEGVTIADCEKASHELAILLDVENFATTPYHLEVSSPGIDRPLKKEKDFKRNLGKDITVIYKVENGKSKTETGTITKCDEGFVEVQVGENMRRIALEDVLSAKLELSFK